MLHLQFTFLGFERNPQPILGWVISLCVPTSSCSAEQYEEVLEELEKKVLNGCKQEGRIPIIGADINGSVGISNLLMLQ